MSRAAKAEIAEAATAAPTPTAAARHAVSDGADADARFRLRYSRAVVTRKADRKLQRQAKKQAGHARYMDRHANSNVTAMPDAPARAAPAAVAPKPVARPRPAPAPVPAPAPAPGSEAAAGGKRPRPVDADTLAIREAKRKLGIRRGRDLEAELKMDGLDGTVCAPRSLAYRPLTRKRIGGCVTCRSPGRARFRVGGERRDRGQRRRRARRQRQQPGRRRR